MAKINLNPPDADGAMEVMRQTNSLDLFVYFMAPLPGGWHESAYLLEEDIEAVSDEPFTLMMGDESLFADDTAQLVVRTNDAAIITYLENRFGATGGKVKREPVSEEMPEWLKRFRTAIINGEV
jgi:hypothetical protein